MYVGYVIIYALLNNAGIAEMPHNYSGYTLFHVTVLQYVEKFLEHSIAAYQAFQSVPHTWKTYVVFKLEL